MKRFMHESHFLFVKFPFRSFSFVPALSFFLLAIRRSPPPCGSIGTKEMTESSNQTSVVMEECWEGLPEEVTERVVIATCNFAFGLCFDQSFYI